MLAKVAYYLKLTAWGILAGACCIAAILANHRAAELPEGEALLRVPKQPIAAEYCDYRSPPASEFVTTTNAARCATSARDSEFSDGSRNSEMPVACEDIRGGEFVADVSAPTWVQTTPPNIAEESSRAEAMTPVEPSSLDAETSATSLASYRSDLSDNWPTTTAQPMSLTEKRHYDREWTFRDPQSNVTVATVKVLGIIETGTIEPIADSPHERETYQTATHAKRRSAVPPLKICLGDVQTAHDSAAPVTENAPAVGQAPEKPELFIATADVDVRELAAQLSQRLSLPIESTGSHTGHVEARMLEDALVELVRPFGYSVRRHQDGLQIVMEDVSAATTAPITTVAPADIPSPVVQASASTAVEPAPLADLIEASELNGTVRLPAIEDADIMIEGQDTHGSASAATSQVTGENDEAARKEAVVVAVRLAKAAVQQGDLDESIEVLTQAALQQPESLVLFRMLGEAYMHRHDFDAAEKAIQTALAINKFDPLTNRIYSEVLAQMEQPERAQHYLEQAQHFESNTF